VSDKELPPADHERTDISVRVVWVGIPVLVLGVLALSLLVLKLYPGGTVDRTMNMPLPTYPDPQLQTDPVKDLQTLRAAQLSRLNGTSWVDEERGVVHIPIEAAMRDISSHGIEDWPATAASDSP